MSAIQNIANELLKDLNGEKSKQVLATNGVAALFVVQAVDQILIEKALVIYDLNFDSRPRIKENSTCLFHAEITRVIEFLTEPNDPNDSDPRHRNRKTEVINDINSMLEELKYDDNSNTLIGQAIVRLSNSPTASIKKLIIKQFREHQGAKDMLGFLKANGVENWYTDAIQLAVQGDRDARKVTSQEVITKWGTKPDLLAVNMTLVSSSQAVTKIIQYDGKNPPVEGQGYWSKLDRSIIQIQRASDPKNFVNHFPQALFLLKIKDTRRIYRGALHYQLLVFHITTGKIMPDSNFHNQNMVAIRQKFLENMNEAIRLFQNHMSESYVDEQLRVGNAIPSEPLYADSLARIQLNQALRLQAGIIPRKVVSLSPLMPDKQNVPEPLDHSDGTSVYWGRANDGSFPLNEPSDNSSYIHRKNYANIQQAPKNQPLAPLEEEKDEVIAFDSDDNVIQLVDQAPKPVAAQPILPGNDVAMEFSDENESEDLHAQESITETDADLYEELEKFDVEVATTLSKDRSRKLTIGFQRKLEEYQRQKKAFLANMKHSGASIMADMRKMNSSLSAVKLAKFRKDLKKRIDNLFKVGNRRRRSARQPDNGPIMQLQWLDIADLDRIAQRHWDNRVEEKGPIDPAADISSDEMGLDFEPAPKHPEPSMRAGNQKIVPYIKHIIEPTKRVEAIDDQPAPEPISFATFFNGIVEQKKLDREIEEALSNDEIVQGLRDAEIAQQMEPTQNFYQMNLPPVRNPFYGLIHRRPQIEEVKNPVRMEQEESKVPSSRFNTINRADVELDLEELFSQESIKSDIQAYAERDAARRDQQLSEHHIYRAERLYLQALMDSNQNRRVPLSNIEAAFKVQAVTGRYAKLFMLDSGDKSKTVLERSIQRVYDRLTSLEYLSSDKPKLPVSMLEHDRFIPVRQINTSGTIYRGDLINLNNEYMPRLLWLKFNQSIHDDPVLKRSLTQRQSQAQTFLQRMIKTGFAALTPEQASVLEVATHLQKELFTEIYKSAMMHLNACQQQALRQEKQYEVDKYFSENLRFTFNAILLQLVGPQCFFQEDPDLASDYAKMREVADYDFSHSNKGGIIYFMRIIAKGNTTRALYPDYFQNEHIGSLCRYFISLAAYDLQAPTRSDHIVPYQEYNSPLQGKGLYLTLFIQWFATTFTTIRERQGQNPIRGWNVYKNPVLTSLFNFLKDPSEPDSGASFQDSGIQQLLQRWCQSTVRHEAMQKCFFIQIEQHDPLSLFETQIVLNSLMPIRSRLNFHENIKTRIHTSHLEQIASLGQHPFENDLTVRVLSLAAQLRQYVTDLEKSFSKNQPHAVPPMTDRLTALGVSNAIATECAYANNYSSAGKQVANWDVAGWSNAKKLVEQIYESLQEHRDYYDRESAQILM